MESLDNIGTLSINELSSGLHRTSARISCIACGEAFEPGVIYQVDDRYVDAERRATEHVKIAHHGALRILTDLPRERTGLTDVQRELVIQLALQKSDREIARETHKSESTIRNQRFHLRRKINEAKVLCAIGNLLNASHAADDDFISYHPDIPAADDRIVTTYAEEREIIKRFFEHLEPLKLERFPKKQKEKLVVLKQIAGKFASGTDYSEPEANEILKQIFDDYVTIRRYLIEYKFLDREPNGSKYWVHVQG